jgi:hypothetical protein
MRGYFVQKSLFSTQKLLRSAVIILVGLAFSTSATAGPTTIYKWVNEDGTRGYSDAKKRVPKEYRNKTTTQSIPSLSGYSKFTLEKDSEKDARLEELNARIAHLRELNESLDRMVGYSSGPPAVSSGPRGTEVIVGSSGGSNGGNFDAVGIPAGATTSGSGGPVVIETKRMRDPESRTTRSNTIYTQDGKVIAVRRPQAIRGKVSAGDEVDYNVE